MHSRAHKQRATPNSSEYASAPFVDPTRPFRTYFVNDAQGGGAEAAAEGGVAARPNVAYKVVRPRGGGVALGLHCLEDIAQGRELLARYDQRVL